MLHTYVEIDCLRTVHGIYLDADGAPLLAAMHVPFVENQILSKTKKKFDKFALVRYERLLL